MARAFLALLNAFGADLSLVPDIAAARKNARDEAEQADHHRPECFRRPRIPPAVAFADIGEHERGVELLRRALVLDPSNAQAHVALGASLVLFGRFDEGIQSMKFGMRSSSKDSA